MHGVVNCQSASGKARAFLRIAPDMLRQLGSWGDAQCGRRQNGKMGNRMEAGGGLTWQELLNPSPRPRLNPSAWAHTDLFQPFH